MTAPASTPLPATTPSGVQAPDTLPPPRELSAGGFHFAGLPAARLVLFACVLGALCWGMWVTRELIRPEPQALVSVRLSKLVADFVSAQARSNLPEDAAALQTAMYMKTLERVLKERSANGATILVAEAVVASSARDVTEEVRVQTASAMAGLSKDSGIALAASNPATPSAPQ
jgi:Type-F conjugative transfer system protein (TrbI_Ftype)